MCAQDIFREAVLTGQPTRADRSEPISADQAALPAGRTRPFRVDQEAGQGFEAKQYEGNLMRTSSCSPSVLILEILRGSAGCVSGRSVCGVDFYIVIRKSVRRNQVKTSFVLHFGRPWLSLGFSS